MGMWRRKPFLPRRLRKSTSEELEKDIEDSRARAEAYRQAIESMKKPPAMSSNTRIVSERTVVCYETGEKHSALLLIHEDEAITVKCPGECVLCDYEQSL